mmetsp:Transcript_78258/g.198943  ORF Transcript_78258/g.198943 Transcript_78258/m.198943 type:complete len:278 (+) Transcript_78258:412-1245(+)
MAMGPRPRRCWTRLSGPRIASSSSGTSMAWCTRRERCGASCRICSRSRCCSRPSWFFWATTATGASSRGSSSVGSSPSKRSELDEEGERYVLSATTIFACSVFSAYSRGPTTNRHSSARPGTARNASWAATSAIVGGARARGTRSWTRCTSRAGAGAAACTSAATAPPRLSPPTTRSAGTARACCGLCPRSTWTSWRVAPGSTSRKTPRWVGASSFMRVSRPTAPPIARPRSSGCKIETPRTTSRSSFSAATVSCTRRRSWRTAASRSSAVTTAGCC